MQAAGELDQALARFETADSWRRYLALKPGEILSTEQTQQHELSKASVSEDNLSKLVAILRRFDVANRDEKNRLITSLPEFQQAHTLLANYVAEQPSESNSRADCAVFTGSSAIDSDSVARMGWAVDTARMPAAYPAENAKESRSSTAVMSVPATEELPEPVAKRGI